MAVRTTTLYSTLVFSIFLLATLPAIAAATTYDLTSDWNDVSNPNGVWSYREGVNLLPHVASWQGLSGDFSTAQPAWARNATGNMNLPCFFRSSGTVAIAHDWLTGDVLTHSTDNLNGVGAGAANILWTSPINGTIDISGNVWMGRDIGRGNHWSLSIRGSVVTSGDISSGDPYSRATPFNFSAGSGGPSVLTGVSVSIGDQVVLEITRTSTPGDYAGIRWTINATAASGVGDPTRDQSLWLGPAVPNPASSRTTIAFRLDAPSPVTLDVYDPSGRLVSTLLHDTVSSGDHSVRWDATDLRGGRVPDGIYFYRLVVGARSVTGRVLIAR